jgi:hypothetical protein
MNTASGFNRGPLLSPILQSLIRGISRAKPDSGEKEHQSNRAAVVAAVSSLPSLPASQEEFFAWQRAFETHDLHGLHATRVQHYRIAHSSRPTSPASPTTTSTQHPLDPRNKPSQG